MKEAKTLSRFSDGFETVSDSVLLNEMAEKIQALGREHNFIVLNNLCIWWHVYSGEDSGDLEDKWEVTSRVVVVLEWTPQVQMTNTHTVLTTVVEARRYRSRVPHAGEIWVHFQNTRICQGTFYLIYPTLPRLVWPGRDSRGGQFSLACYS